MTLLLDERPVVIQPSLVRRLGIIEAAIVQQLHYWAQRATCVHEGEQWVYKTYADWADEIGVSAKQARGALDRMRTAGVVIAIQNPTESRDRTLWWRVDLAVVDPRPAGHAPVGSSSSAPQGTSSNALAGTSNAGASQGRSESTTQTTTKMRNGARASDALPEGFPEHLHEHAAIVHRVLVSVAEQHNARVVTLRAVGLAMLGHRGRRYVEIAHDLASWAQAPPRPVVDVTATYRTFLKREPERAGVESLRPAIAASAPATQQFALVRGGRRDAEAERLARQARRAAVVRGESA